jgi:hypothetical protein
MLEYRYFFVSADELTEGQIVKLPQEEEWNWKSILQLIVFALLSAASFIFLASYFIYRLFQIK